MSSPAAGGDDTGPSKANSGPTDELEINGKKYEYVENRTASAARKELSRVKNSRQLSKIHERGYYVV